MDSTTLVAASRIADARTAACQPLAAERLDRAKSSYAMRRIHTDDMATLLSGPEITSRAGDLVLARIDRVRQHCRIELPSGRRAHLFPNDEVLLCYAARYAPDQFEAIVPDDPGSLSHGGGQWHRRTGCLA